MKVLLTGGAGYIGSVLVRKLLAAGHGVRVVDTLDYGSAGLPRHRGDGDYGFIEGDVREFKDEWLGGVDAVWHLAGFSNDPTADLSPAVNRDVNVGGTVNVVESCLRAGVERFVFASSASVYDRKLGERPPYSRERSSIAPIGGYSQSKYEAEMWVLGASQRSSFFKPIIFRQGTVYGCSPRMRFDLVVNTMCRSALVDHEVRVHGTGENWRPVLDIQTCASAYLQSLEADTNEWGGRVINLADENHSIRNLAWFVNDAMRQIKRECRIVYVPTPEGVRFRNYRMELDRQEEFGVKPARTINQAILEILRKFGTLTEKQINDPKYSNIEMAYKHLVQA